MTLDLHHHTKIAQPFAWRMPLKDGTRESCPVCLQQGRGEQTAAHCRFSRYKIVQSRSKQRSSSTHSMIHPKYSQDQTRCSDSSSRRTHAPQATASLLITKVTTTIKRVVHWSIISDKACIRSKV